MRELTKKGAIVLVVLITLVAVLLWFLWSNVGLLLSGAIGIFASMGAYFTDEDREIARQRYTQRPLDDPLLDGSEYADLSDPPHIKWSLLCLLYSFMVIGLGIIL